MIFVLVFVMLAVFSAVHADDLSDVKQAGVLQFGHHLEYVPFIFEDSSGNTNGIDIALMEEVARRMGVQLQTIPLAWDGIIDSLNVGQADVIGGGLAITDERQQRIDFTRPYYSAESLFISLPSLNKPEQVTLDSFRGLKIAVEKGSDYETWIKENLVDPGYITAADVYDYTETPAQLNALENGTVDLVVMAEDLYIGLYQNTGKYQIFSDDFMKETFAFGLRKGSTLTQEINDQLTAIINDGTAQDIANRFFSMNFDDIVDMMIRPKPTAVPIVIPTYVPSPASCVNAMIYEADVTVPDGTVFNPGQGFQKTWRVLNSGTCTWDPGYTFSLASGTSMGTNIINIPGNVAPGQTVDLTVTLIAPNTPGSYKGNWQMRSPQGASFGQIVWVNIVVDGGSPVQPTAMPGPGGAQIGYLYAAPNEGYEGSCTNVYWAVSNASSARMFVNGVELGSSTDGSGVVTLCDEIRDPGTYEIRLDALSDGGDATASIWYTTNEEGQHRVIPEIYYFYADPADVVMNICTTVYWSVSDPIIGLEIFLDGSRIENTSDSTGSREVCAPHYEDGTYEVQLVAHSITDDASQTTYFTVDSKAAPEPVLYDDGPGLLTGDDQWMNNALLNAVGENPDDSRLSGLTVGNGNKK